MGLIRYVCLSDQHLGYDLSLLTKLDNQGHPVYSEVSPVMQVFCDGLRELLQKNRQENGAEFERMGKPTLVLMGDVLDLAFSTMNGAGMVFETFMRLISQYEERLFDRIIFIPGNHDHHLWETAREIKYLDYVRTHPDQPTIELIPWHATNVFVTKDSRTRQPDTRILTLPIYSEFLTILVQKIPVLNDHKVQIAYPNFGLFNQDNSNCVLFHHGHFFEGLYYFTSTLKELIFPHQRWPTNVWDIECENFAWIDFVWSELGRSGQVGKDMETIYERLIKRLQVISPQSVQLPGLDQIQSEPESVITETSHHLAESVYSLFDRLAADWENSLAEHRMSDHLRFLLRWYVDCPFRSQVIAELGRSLRQSSPMTLLFGHTHKPLLDIMHLAAWGKIYTYNTGGWLIQSIDPKPVYGAALAFINEDLQTAYLRMYEEGKPGLELEAETLDFSAKDFVDQINGLIEQHAIWDGFGETANEAVKRREEFLEKRSKDQASE
jgi:hypothetical protein